MDEVAAGVELRSEVVSDVDTIHSLSHGWKTKELIKAANEQAESPQGYKNKNARTKPERAMVQQTVFNPKLAQKF